MSLSVIMPNYNHAQWLPQALGALLQQSVPADEIIVIDDGSTDDSVAIIEALQRTHPSLRLIRHETNRGVAAAVVTGLAAATGDLLLFAAADDFVLPSLFARAITALHTNPEAAFFCAEVAVLDHAGRVRGFRPITAPRETAGYMSPAEVRRGIRASDNWFIGTSIVYRHSHLQAIGYFDWTLGALCDAMATRLLAFRHGFYFSPEVLATWRVSPASVSGSATLSLAENERMLDAAARCISQKFPDDTRQSYGPIYQRRLRFSFARQRLVWADGKIDSAGIAAVMQWGAFDQSVLRVLSAMPLGSSRLVLAWLALRARPYSIGALARSFVRSLVLNRSRRREVQRLLASGSPGGR